MSGTDSLNCKRAFKDVKHDLDPRGSSEIRHYSNFLNLMDHCRIIGTNRENCYKFVVVKSHICIEKYLHSLEDIVVKRMLGGKNSVQGPLVLKLLFVGLKTMSPSVTEKHPAHRNIYCALFKLSIMCLYHISISNLIMTSKLDLVEITKSDTVC